MIHLLPNNDQVQIVDAITALLAESAASVSHKPEEIWPATAHRGTHEALGAFGLFGLALPEEAGGLGCGLSEEMLAFVEIGRALASPTALASSLAARILSSQGDIPARDRLVASETTAAFAIAQPDGIYLVDAQDAQWILLAATDALHLYPARAVLVGQAIDSFDPTLHITTGQINGDAIARATPDVLGAFHVLLAAMAVGCSEANLVLATEYAKTREQFGQPIGAFQAVKHHCSNMAVANQCALTQTALAAVCADSGTDDARFLAHAALVTALDAAITNGRLCIQVHGGIGFTAEHRAHLYLKRAHLMTHLAGGITAHLEASLEVPLA